MPILIMASELHKDIRKVYVSQISTSTTAPTTLTVTTVSTNNLLTVNSTISNLNLSTSTISNINATNITSTNFIGSNATLTNSVFTTLTSGTINFTTAIGSTGITIPSLLATTSISSASIQGTNITITNSNFTNLTSSTINFTNAIGTTSTIGTIRSTNVISTNLSSSTINATGSTVGTFNVTGMSTLQNTTVTNQTLSTLNATTGITTGTLLATSIQATNIVSSNTSSGTLLFTTAVGSTGLTTGTILATTSISTGQMASTNLSTSTINATGGTIGTLNITGTSTLQNTTATNQTLATLNATTGITTATLLATTSISTGQFTSNNISSGTINVSTGITTSTLLATSSISTGQLASANISTTNLYVTTLITGSNLGVNNLTTGTLRVSSTRGILIGSSTDIDNGSLISAHNNTLGSGGQTYITLGVGASSNNQSEFSFAYFTSGSTLNRTSIGLFGSPNTLSILGTGNVGVGNTNPSYKFDVTGDMRATGNIYLGGGYIYPNTNITTASNLFLNVYSGTLSINGPTTLLGYGINAAGTSTLGNIVSISNGNVGIGVAAPNSILQVGASVDTIYGNNPLASNRVNIFGPARASPTYAGTTDMNGTVFINSTSTYGRNVGASIALGGRSNNFGGGNLHMAFARINGVQATNTDTYDGNFVIETQAAGSMYERLRIIQDGNIGIGTTNPLYLLDVNGTIDAVAYTGANINISGSIQAGGNIGAIGNLTNGGYDFILGNANQVARGNSGASRALVKDGAASLIMNYSGDFTGGVEVQGNFFRTIGNSNTIGNIFTTGGNLGIGTGAPSNRLHVHNSAAAQDVRIILSDATTTVSSSRGFHMIKNGSQHGYLWNYENGFLQLGTNNTPVITMTGGNVGIGTATPGYRLDVNGNIKNNADILMDSASRLTIYNPTGGLQIRSGGSNMLHLNQDNNANISIGVGGGNVGVGTTAPNWKLDVVGAVECTDWFRSLGNTGWYNQTHGRGIYATDTTWVRTYPDRNAFLCGTLNCYDITTNSNNIAMAGGTITFSNNGAGLNWGSSFSRIYDDGHLRIYTDDNLYFNIGGTNTGYMNTTGFGIFNQAPYCPLDIGGGRDRSTIYGTITIYQYLHAGHGDNWLIGADKNSNANLYFLGNTNNGLEICAFIENDSSGLRIMNFTGQHRCNFDETINSQSDEGLIVCATGKYSSLMDKYDDTSEADHIQINEALPIITLASENNDKSVFGVISYTEDPNKTRTCQNGRFVSIYDDVLGDRKRVYVNSLGEGAIWVCNINGSFQNGDLITTSNIPGYGKKQDSTSIENYTVGKITMNCDFNPQLVPVKTIRKKQITKTIRKKITERQDIITTNKEIVWDNDKWVEKEIQETSSKDVPVMIDVEVFDTNGNSLGIKNIQKEEEISITEEVPDLDENGELVWLDKLDEYGNSILKPAYKTRYLKNDGTQITFEEYNYLKNSGHQVYIAAFVGCTYHCG